MTRRLLIGLLAVLCTQTFAADTVAELGSSILDYQIRNTQALVEITPLANPPELTTKAFPSFVPGIVPEDNADNLIAGVTQMAVYPNLWDRIRAGFQMPDLDTEITHKWELYYASRPEYLNRVVERASRYLYHVVNEVEKRGVPMEIALLPIIESAYNPKAESTAHATGMWQFIPETGKRYGLERTWWYDGRRDVFAATSAALDYLTEIHGMFGDWQLALASYNWGENAVARAVAKNKTAGLPSGYADLRMPTETANYVPKLMAMRNIIANPEAFGVTLESLPNKPYFIAIDNTRHMDVKIAAQLAEISIAELLRLNPGFIRPVIAQKGDRKLILPASKVEAFQRNLASYDKPLLTWQPYVTHPKQDFDKLAKQFGISPAELKDVNDIAAKDRTAHGQTILVPKADHLDISDRQTLAALAANRVAEPVDHGEHDKPRRLQLVKNMHRVAKGETITSIAQRYKIPVTKLALLNGIKGERVKIGTMLNVTGTKPTPKDKRQYIAKHGDTLAVVARKFNVATVDLAKWNNFGRKGLQPGAKITIY